MDDNAGTLRNHRRQQRTIKTNGRHQVLVQLLRPLRIVERRESAARRAGATEYIDKDVDATELLKHRLGHRAGAFGSREISSEKVHAFEWPGRNGTCRGHDLRSGVTESFYNSGSDSLRSAGDERTAIREFEVEAHGAISRDAIFPRSSRKTNRKSTGLPGKWPVR